MSEVTTLFCLAALLGLKHGLDADHLAAIDGLARLQVSAGRAPLARLSGFLFSAGHGAVVVRAAAARDPAAALVVGAAFAFSLDTLSSAAWYGTAGAKHGGSTGSGSPG